MTSKPVGGSELSMGAQHVIDQEEETQGGGRDHDVDAQGAWPEVEAEQDHHETYEAVNHVMEAS